MITTAEAMAACLARGRRAADCEEIIASQSVDGTYCEGTIVLDATGRRCVPRELADRVKVAREADPLPVVEPPARNGIAWLVGGAVAAAVVLVFFARSR